jgi:hypothetical protein
MDVVQLADALEELDEHYKAVLRACEFQPK